MWDSILYYLSEEGIKEFFAQYAYRPGFVYTGIVIFMTASSFGFPLPEEVILVSSGFIAYMAMNPQLYPPPTMDSVAVNVYVLALVCFLSVILSDFLVYLIGRYFGETLMKTKFFKNKIGMKRFEQINHWFHKYSNWACGMFRFMPGIRFPGHLSCGFLKVPLWKFIGIDGTAALLSVPTQVLLVAFNGEIIIARMKQFKLIIFGVITVFIIGILIKKWIAKKKMANA